MSLIGKKSFMSGSVTLPPVVIAAPIVAEPVIAAPSVVDDAPIRPLKAGKFITYLTSEDIAAIKAAYVVVADFETTALTPYAIGEKVGVRSTAKIGGTHTVHQYCKELSCTINLKPRARILTVGLVNADDLVGASVRTLAYDLDALSIADQQILVSAAFDKTIVVGHNLGFDLFWASIVLGRTPQPAQVVDTMLIARLARPSIELLSLQKAVGSSTLRKLLIPVKRKTMGISLNVLSVTLKLGLLDKKYQKPINWVPAVLSEGHYDYVCGDVTTPLQVAKGLLTIEDDITVGALIDKCLAINLHKEYSAALVRLVQMSVKGMPWNATAAQTYQTKHVAAATKAGDDLLAEAPEHFKAFETQIRKMSGAEPADLKAALNAYCVAKTGIALPLADGGMPSTSATDIALIPELAKLPGMIAYMQLKSSKKMVSMAEEMSSLAEADDRLHPLISLSTVTLRTASQSPNSQNMPRDPEFRALVSARPGHKILSIDYGQIELRIAAALAARAWDELLIATPASHPSLNWRTLEWIGFRDARRLALSDEELPARTAKPKHESGIDALREHLFAEAAHLMRRVKSGGLVMAGVFQAGLDPHLLTGLAKAFRNGKVDGAGLSALEYLKGCSGDDRKALKDNLKAERQTAKPNNFGLLYGMSAEGLWELGVSSYGLNWTKEEAAQDRGAWMDLYPELALWQFWVTYSQSKKHTFPMMKFNSYKKSWAQEENPKTWAVKTLAGRPLVAVVARDGMNYQDQGTGADMIMTAIARMPQPAADYMINIVHDELVFEVPDDRLEEVQAQAEAMMQATAAELLDPFGIPVEAESSVGDVWIH